MTRPISPISAVERVRRIVYQDAEHQDPPTQLLEKWNQERAEYEPAGHFQPGVPPAVQHREAMKWLCGQLDERGVLGASTDVVQVPAAQLRALALHLEAMGQPENPEAASIYEEMKRILSQLTGGRK